MVAKASHPDFYTLIVVADEAAAVFYSRENRRAPLCERSRLENEAARKKTAELESDRGGRSFDRYGPGRHGVGKELHDAKRHAAEVFAREIAARIEQTVRTAACVDYVVIAAPRFLGMLRQALGTTSCPPPSTTIDKDVTSRDPGFIATLLDEHRR